MSDRSFRRWQRASGFIGALLGQTDLCLAQTEEDGARFESLGVPAVATTGNVKYDVAPPPAESGGVSDMVARIGARPVWLAASTHAEEEIFLLEVHEAVARNQPGLLTLLVPRHPGRGAAITEAARMRGLRVALRSHNDPLEEATQLYVADTIGELGLFYRTADVVFMGKSLAGGGGQNPIEAAKLGLAILHGPLVDNFGEIYELLGQAGGAIEVADAEILAETVSSLLTDTALLRRMARAAAEAVERHGGATARIMLAIAPYLPEPARSGRPDAAPGAGLLVA